jgi:DNA invertase Pin-like site-specific DNA recombinase
MFGMMGVFAEFERSMIVARVNAGMARAKASGTKSGKAIGRPRITSKVEQRIRDELATGKGILKVASLVGVGSGTVQRVREMDAR